MMEILQINYKELTKNCEPFLRVQPEFLTINGIKQRYQVSRSFVYSLIKGGALKPYSFDDDSKHSRTFIKVAEFEAALKPKAWADK